MNLVLLVLKKLFSKFPTVGIFLGIAFEFFICDKSDNSVLKEVSQFTFRVKKTKKTNLSTNEIHSNTIIKAEQTETADRNPSMKGFRTLSYVR